MLKPVMVIISISYTIKDYGSTDVVGLHVHCVVSKVKLARKRKKKETFGFLRAWQKFFACGSKQIKEKEKLGSSPRTADPFLSINFNPFLSRRSLLGERRAIVTKFSLIFLPLFYSPFHPLSRLPHTCGITETFLKIVLLKQVSPSAGENTFIQVEF